MPHQEVLIVHFRQENKEKTFRIGTKLGEDHQQRLIALIREFEDIFVWGPEDMPGIDPAIAVHRLYVEPTFSPIKQKKRQLNDEKNSHQGRSVDFVKSTSDSRVEIPRRLVDSSAGHERISQIRRNMEIYMDDMLVKSRTRTDHLGNLRKTINRLRESLKGKSMQNLFIIINK
ncbi:hypothetical protein LIER_17603 [Lithospermum erythrorhizon]|uniref:Reverse transcriptase domain-containing protein n=1 Tax=Lithospermum erythrorhizon TaxID=34254 RepID=A0AAV3QC99_LITER